jgi:hypothetical protein
MIKKILYKWLGLEDESCPTCELLKMQLAACDMERKDLLNRLINPIEKKEEVIDTRDLEPIQSGYIPWSVRRQMLEKEDRVKAQVLREKEKEILDSKIPELEKELGVENG